MLRYGFTIFLGAFLLFMVQPMIAKFILPWFGGTATVWTTCMMFFQVVLLVGYLYAHGLRRFFTPRGAFRIHLGMLFLACVAALWAQATPPEFLKPKGGENLTLAIVQLLAVTVGLPFLVLSATGPLVQAWHSVSEGGETYRLYALSNAGSMLALLSYPFLFERLLRLHVQAIAWTSGFVAFVGFCVASGWPSANFERWQTDSKELQSDCRSRISKSDVRVGWQRIIIWTLLAMAPSIILMATTNLMSQEVASIPFLWLLPLTLYLLSLIICFDKPTLYRRWLFIPLLLCSIAVSVVTLHLSNQISLLPQVISLAVVCFSVAMSCHGELERLKPAPDHLTLFYLMISVGGAAGGVFVAAIAPRIFTDFYEFHIGLLLSLLLVLGVKVVEAYHAPNLKHQVATTWLATIGGLLSAGVVISSLIYFVESDSSPGLLAFERNEYGLVSVRESGDYRVMVNGRTEHGGQFLDTKKSLVPSGYYREGSGPAVALRALRSAAGFDPAKGLHVGVVGLGTGSLICWGTENDRFCFYEINPLSEILARKYFTYLDAFESTKVVLGDGRASLEHQLGEHGPLAYDLLVLDAFSSDSIPAHLLTIESFELYQKHLNPHGAIVVHISNRFVDVGPVVFGLAQKMGMTPVLLYHFNNLNERTRWVIVTRNEEILKFVRESDTFVQWPEQMEPIVWTDDFTSLAQVVDWSFKLKWNPPSSPATKKSRDPSEQNGSDPSN